MKRYVALLACVLALAACGNDGGDASAATANGGGNNAASAQKDGQGNAADSAGKAGDFDSVAQKRSYALGMDIGNSLKDLPVDVDVEMLSQGVSDTVNDKKTRLTQKQMAGVMQGFVKQMKAEQNAKNQKKMKANLANGRKFLAKNKKKPGVKTTDSGLQYKVIKKGSGPQPDENDKVTVHYVGKLLNGTVFDSSRKRGKPVTFPVDAVIPGWTEALQLMHQGAKYKLFIPPDLAYGKRGAGPKIGPNQTLVFNVELLKVAKQKAQAKSGGGNAQSGAQNGGNANAGAAAQGGGNAGGQGNGGQSNNPGNDQGNNQGNNPGNKAGAAAGGNNQSGGRNAGGPNNGSAGGGESGTGSAAAAAAMKNAGNGNGGNGANGQAGGSGGNDSGQSQ